MLTVVFCPTRRFSLPAHKSVQKITSCKHKKVLLSQFNISRAFLSKPRELLLLYHYGITKKNNSFAPHHGLLRCIGKMDQENTCTRFKLFLVGALALALGLVAYLLYNPRAFISKRIYEFFKLRPPKNSNTIIETIIRNWAADFLWMVAFTLFVQAILYLRKKSQKKLVLCALLGLVYEALQFFGVIIGVADVGDIIAYVLGSLFALLIINTLREVRHHD